MRSFLFNLAFYGFTSLVAIACLPLTYMKSAKPLANIVHWWAKMIVWFLNVIAGVKLEIRGQEHVPTEGPSLIASKPQSFSYGILVLSLIRDISTVAMKDLLQYPAIGRILTKLDMIMVDTCGGGNARDKLSSAAQVAYDAKKHRSEEHTSELQSRSDLVCRLLLEKKKIVNKVE